MTIRSSLLSLLVLVGVGCLPGGDDDLKACIEHEVTYGGDAFGSLYVRDERPDGSRGLSSYGDSASALLRLAPSPNRGVTVCYGRASEAPVTTEFVAWIDIGGDDEACDLFMGGGDLDACEPGGADPISVVVLDIVPGYETILFDLVDP